MPKNKRKVNVKVKIVKDIPRMSRGQLDPVAEFMLAKIEANRGKNIEFTFGSEAEFRRATARLFYHRKSWLIRPMARMGKLYVTCLEKIPKGKNLGS
jgi:hypothetical protein